ncbi:MAG: GNAT family N-acetyltransferase [Armatimonadota bacterium]
MPAIAAGTAAGASRARHRAERLTIRRLQRTDIEACARIVAGEPLWRRYGQTARRARTTIREALGSRGSSRASGAAGEFAVARQGRDVIGFIWFRLDGTFHHSGYVRWVAVAAGARGRGVGARLMEYAERRIFRRGLNIFLLVSDFNRGAQAFYRKRGYTRVGAVPDYLVPGITEYLYWKTLGPIARSGVRGHDAPRFAPDSLRRMM